MLKVNNMSEKHILKNVNFAINPGDRLVIVGPNGGGKSTLLSQITELSQPTQGTIENDLLPIGEVFQNNILDDDLTVYDNLKLRSVTQQQFQVALDKLYGLHIDEKKKYRELSGGQKRIVNYIRVIINQPQLLILDEMSVGIDYDIRHILWQDILAYLKEKSNSALIFTTHNLDEIAYANKILFLKDGQVSYFGAVDQYMKTTPKCKLLDENHQVVKYFESAYEASQYVVVHL